MPITKIKFLGSGPAWPIPRLGCKCRTCEYAKQSNSKSRRTRPSVYVEHDGKKILIDCGPDFYYQMSRENIEDLDYILISHSHNDHVAGLDDVLPMVERKNEKITLITSEEIYKELEEKFSYIVYNFDKKLLRCGEQFEINGLKISYVPIIHGSHTLGFVLDSNKKFVYLSDITEPLDKTYLEEITNADYLVLDGSAIINSSNIFHLSLGKQLEMAKEAKAKNIIFTHIGHRCPPHEELEEIIKVLYPKSRIAYDGMEI